MEEERNIITFFCFNGANCNGVGNSEMVYWESLNMKSEPRSSWWELLHKNTWKQMLVECIQIQPSTNASHTPFVSRSAHYLQSHHILQQTFFSTHARNLNPKAQCHDQSFNTTYIQTMATQITQILETGRQNSLQSIGNDYVKDRFCDIFVINYGIFWTNSAKYRIFVVIFRNI